MIRLMRADLARLVKSRAFGLSLAGMLALSAAFMVMQATAMDYSVPLSRVIFLPMSMYGVAAAALVSVFAGDDFSGGFRSDKTRPCPPAFHTFWRRTPPASTRRDPHRR
ncbi:MAG: hypothetical protein IKI23_07605, partial [Lachnospiraceae bacterium]|nr:hypothetical protein [Lachnospiraceae bacterium]